MGHSHTGLRSGSSQEKESSEGMRKFDKKLQFYAKVIDTVASLRARKEVSKNKKSSHRQKKWKAYDLTSLNECLPELKDPGKQCDEKNLMLNNKTRPKLVEKEGRQLKAVLSNPVFQLDPLAAIHQHLEITQPIYPIVLPKKKLKRSGKYKGTKPKATSAAQPMDF